MSNLATVVDRGWVEALYRQHGPMVLRRARRILGNEQAAQDAMQEVFVRAIKAGAEFRGDSSPTTWLYRVTTNHCLNVIRDGARRRELLREGLAKPEAIETRPEDRLDVSKILAQLPAELQDIAVYYFVDQMNQAEIAEMIGVSRRTIGNRLEEFRRLATEAAGPKPSLEVT